MGVRDRGRCDDHLVISTVSPWCCRAAAKFLGRGLLVLSRTHTCGSAQVQLWVIDMHAGGMPIDLGWIFVGLLLRQPVYP
jgi:hypothetical protein